MALIKASEFPGLDTSADAAGESMMSHRDRSDLRSQPWWVGDKKKVFDADAMTDVMMEEYHMARLDGVLSAFFGSELRSGNDTLMGMIAFRDRTLSTTQRKEVFNRIIERVALYKLVLHQAPPRFIRFKDCALNIEDMERYIVNSDMIIANIIPWKWNPSAYNEDVDRMLDRISCGNKCIRDLIEEMVGYCMYRDLSFRKAFILKGGKRNGKSTLLNLLSFALGPSNLCNLGLHSYEREFYRIRLFGMLANIGDDISSSYIEESEHMKKLMSGEPVEASEKYEKTVSFRSYATSIFSANEPPKFNDSTGALFDRFIFVPMNAYFSEEDSDLGLASRMHTESGAQYFLKLGVAGLRRLLKNGRFTQCTEVKDAKTEIMSANDHVASWLQDYDPIWRDTSEIFTEYESFVLDNGIKKGVYSKIGLMQRINATLNTWTHPYGGHKTIEPMATKGMSAADIKIYKIQGKSAVAENAASNTSAEDVLARYRRQWDEAGAETCMDMDASGYTARELDFLLSEGLIYSPARGRYVFGVRQ